MKKTTKLAALLLCAVLLLTGVTSAIEVVDPTEVFMWQTMQTFFLKKRKAILCRKMIRSTL